MDPQIIKNSKKTELIGKHSEIIKDSKNRSQGQNSEHTANQGVPRGTQVPGARGSQGPGAHNGGPQGGPGNKTLNPDPNQPKPHIICFGAPRAQGAHGTQGTVGPT